MSNISYNQATVGQRYTQTHNENTSSPRRSNGALSRKVHSLFSKIQSGILCFSSPRSRGPEISLKNTATNSSSRISVLQTIQDESISPSKTIDEASQSSVTQIEIQQENFSSIRMERKNTCQAVIKTVRVQSEEITKEESLQRKEVAEFFSLSERLFQETLGGASTKQSEMSEREFSSKFSLKNLFHRTSTKKHESQEPASFRLFCSLKKLGDHYAVRVLQESKSTVLDRNEFSKIERDHEMIRDFMSQEPVARLNRVLFTICKYESGLSRIQDADEREKMIALSAFIKESLLEELQYREMLVDPFTLQATLDLGLSLENIFCSEEGWTAFLSFLSRPEVSPEDAKILPMLQQYRKLCDACTQTPSSQSHATTVLPLTLVHGIYNTKFAELQQLNQKIMKSFDELNLGYEDRKICLDSITHSELTSSERFAKLERVNSARLYTNYFLTAVTSPDQSFLRSSEFCALCSNRAVPAAFSQKTVQFRFQELHQAKKDL